jgi:hypothetical protein
MSRPSTGSQDKVEITPPQPDDSQPDESDIVSQALAQIGKDAIDDFIKFYTTTGPTEPGPVIIDPILIDPELIIPPSPPSDPEPSVPQFPVCILGAGVAGLYIAMMLDSLDIKYELMEGSGRTGGRLYTHNFPKNAGKYQYYVINIF